MNRKGSLPNTKPKVSYRKGSSEVDPRAGNVKSRKSSVTENEKSRKSALNVNSIAKISLGIPMLVGTTPSKAFATPTNNKATYGLGTSIGESIKRQSFRASGMGMKKKPAQWQISDPSYKAACIDKILDFLLSNNFDGNITRSTLKSPSAKDFACIFTFIYEFSDLIFKLSKMEEQIPKLMKLHCFPGQIMTKSTFLNVGSPHAWPTVLSMLAWLCDATVIDSDELIVQHMLQKDFDSQKTGAELKLNLFISYFTNQEEDFNNVIENYRVELENYKNISYEYYEELSAILDDLPIQLEKLSCKGQELASFKEIYLTLESDYEKLTIYKDKMELVVQEKEKERISTDKHRDDVQLEIDEVEMKIGNIKELKNNQDLSLETIESIKCYKDKYISMTAYYKQEQNDFKQKHWKEETELAKLINNLSTFVCEFASKSRQLGCDCSFLSNVHLHHIEFNKNKEKLEILMKDSVECLKSEIIMFKNDIANIAKDINGTNDNTNDAKKRVTKQEKQLDRWMQEKNKLKRELSIEGESCQVQYDSLSEEILCNKRGPKYNSHKQTELEGHVIEYKSLVEKNKKDRSEAKDILTKKIASVDLFLAKKAEIISNHNKIMQDMQDKFSEKKNKFYQTMQMSNIPPNSTEEDY